MDRPLLIFSGQSNRPLAQAIAEALGLPLGKSTTLRFANDNLFVRYEESLREGDVFIVQSFVPPVQDHLMELLMMVDAAKGASAARVTAVIPYFSYARSDKKDAPRISITARLIADLLQTAGADRVLTMTLHSPQVRRARDRQLLRHPGGPGKRRGGGPGRRGPQTGKRPRPQARPSPGLH